MSKRRLLFAAFSILGGAVLVACYSTWPYGWDQGIYAWMGQTIRRGGVAYRDAWDFKGPTAAYLTALGQLVFSDTVAGLRLFDLVLLAAGAAATWHLARRLFEDRRSAIAATTVQVGWYFAQGFWNTAQTDGWVSWMMTGAALLAVGGTPWWGVTLAGGLVGLGVLLKPLYVLFALPLLFLALASRRRYTPIRIVGWGTVGVVAPLVAAVACFARAGALRDARFAFLEYTAGVYSALGPGAVAAVLRRGLNWLLESRVLPAAIPFAVLGWYSWRSTDSRLRTGLGLWVLCALLLIVVQQKFYGYHTLVVLPPLSLLAGHGVASIWDAWRHRSDRTPDRRLLLALATPALALLVIHLTVFSGNDAARWVGHVVGRTAPEEYLDGFGVPGAEYRVATLLTAASEPSDSVLVWGMNTSVLALSHRASWTRFGFNLPILLQPNSPTTARIRREFAERFARSLPRFVVIGERHEQVERSASDPLECGLMRLIEAEYVLRLTADPLRLYELAPGKGAARARLEPAAC